jgi:hypothetical protein
MAGQSMADLEVLLDVRLALALSCSGRWSSLQVFTDYSRWVGKIRRFTRATHPALLQSVNISFRRGYTGGDYFFDSGREAAMPIAFFSASIPALESLRLRGVGYDWQTSHLRSLKSLTIDSPPIDHSPSYGDYAFVLRNCTNLTHLCLKFSECPSLTGDGDMRGLDTIFSASMESLHLAFGMFTSGARLVSLFRFPNLKEVDIKLISYDALKIALLCAPLFGGMRFLQLANPALPTALWDAFRVQFPAMVPLNLAEPVDIGLYDYRSDQILPLTLNPVPADDVARFFAFRQSIPHRDRLTLVVHLPELEMWTSGQVDVEMGPWIRLQDTIVKRDQSEGVLVPDLAKIWSVVCADFRTSSSGY